MSQQGTFGTGNPPSSILTLTGDTGGPITPTSGNINIFGDATNIDTVGHPATSTINVILRNTVHLPASNTAGTSGIYYINNVPFLYGDGVIEGNVFVGGAGNLTLNSTGPTTNCVGVGSVLTSVNQGLGGAQGCTAIGSGPLDAMTHGQNQTAIGFAALSSLTSSGNGNTVIGVSGADNLLTGGANIVLSIIDHNGVGSASSWTGSESSNICLGSPGVIGDNHIIRLGESGGLIGQQNKCFIAGIQGITPGVVGAQLTIIDTNGQIGSLGTATNGQLPIGSVGANPVLSTLTAGTNISITNAAGSITIASSGTPLVNTYTNVNATPYTVTINDYYLSVDTSALAITIQLPNAPTTNRTFIIKDRTGSAATRNISVTTLGGAVTIDGVTTFTMNNNFQAINLVFNGTSYEIY